MPHKSVEEIAEGVRKMASAWHAAQCAEEQWRVESQIGEEIFSAIFAEDTTVLGPWQLKTKGKRKEEKYEEFKTRWDALCSSDDLGISSKDLLAWSRCVGLRRFMSEHGLNSRKLSWLALCEIQRLKSVNLMIERAKKAAEELLGGGTEPHPAESASNCPAGSVEEQGSVHHQYSPCPAEAKEVATEPGPKPQPEEPESKPYATLEGLERILEQPAALLANAQYMERMADPSRFKDLSPARREQLRGRVEQIARELEASAQSYRDFEAVLRWSRRI